MRYFWTAPRIHHHHKADPSSSLGKGKNTKEQISALPYARI